MTQPASPLRVLAGPRARARLREAGLVPQDFRVVPAAAGGPKGLVFGPLDQYLFGQWFANAPQTLHLMGASIGAWRMACAAMPDPVAALRQLSEDYVTQQYDHEPGRPPAPAHVSERFASVIESRLGRRAADLLAHPNRRLHVFTSRGRGLLGREARVRTALGYAVAFGANALARRALGGHLRRVVFSDPRDPLPVPLQDFPSEAAVLSTANLTPSLLASCSIPFWLKAVHDIPGGARGAYWDGGITDYHLHLNYAAMPDGLVLYPHFSDRLVPGWLDKAWRRRHRATAFLDNLVLLVPHPDWVRTLPNGKLPDRGDFKAYGDDHPSRQRDWRCAVAASQALAEAFDFLARQRSVEAESLP